MEGNEKALHALLHTEEGLAKGISGTQMDGKYRPVNEMSGTPYNGKRLPVVICVPTAVHRGGHESRETCEANAHDA